MGCMERHPLCLPGIQKTLRTHSPKPVLAHPQSPLPLRASLPPAAPRTGTQHLQGGEVGTWPGIHWQSCNCSSHSSSVPRNSFLLSTARPGATHSRTHCLLPLVTRVLQRAFSPGGGSKPLRSGRVPRLLTPEESGLERDNVARQGGGAVEVGEMPPGTYNSSHSPAVRPPSPHPGCTLPFCPRQSHPLPAAVTRLFCELLADHPGRQHHCITQ